MNGMNETVITASKLLKELLEENTQNSFNFNFSSDCNLSDDDDGLVADELLFKYLSKRPKLECRKLPPNGTGQKVTTTTPREFEKVIVKSEPSTKGTDTDDESDKEAGKRFHTHLLECDDPTFESHFQITRQTFEKLLQILEPLQFEGIEKIPLPKIQITLIGLWLLTTDEDVPATASRFGITEEMCKDASMALSSTVLSNRLFVQPPWSSDDYCCRVVNDFNRLKFANFFPKTFGIIGTTDLTVSSWVVPKHLQQRHPNNLGVRRFLKIQCVCDARGRFLDFFVKKLGNIPVEELFEKSLLYEMLENDQGHLKLADGSFMLGSVAYPLKNYLMTPIAVNSDRPLPPMVTRYNRIVHARLNILRRSFTRLKQRFRKLQWVNFTTPGEIKQSVALACAIHNFCLMQNDKFNTMWMEFDVASNENVPSKERPPLEAIQKRNNIIRMMLRANNVANNSNTN